ncbi:hypothetical protein B0H13DRAFT_1870318 [Mycena leptocephala]|nr:hypothetical protein B0H13DRAFT_1870318 [Mycena leptocephala]
MVLLALAIAPFGAASAVFSASTPKPPMRLLDLVKRRGTVAGPVLNTSFPDPGLILPDGRPPCYLRYMNLSEHLISTFNFAILHSLNTHFVYLLAIKSMLIMTNKTCRSFAPADGERKTKSEECTIRVLDKPKHFNGLLVPLRSCGTEVSGVFGAEGASTHTIKSVPFRSRSDRCQWDLDEIWANNLPVFSFSRERGNFDLQQQKRKSLSYDLRGLRDLENRARSASIERQSVLQGGEIMVGGKTKEDPGRLPFERVLSARPWVV